MHSYGVLKHKRLLSEQTAQLRLKDELARRWSLACGLSCHFGKCPLQCVCGCFWACCVATAAACFEIAKLDSLSPLLIAHHLLDRPNMSVQGAEQYLKTSKPNSRCSRHLLMLSMQALDLKHERTRHAAAAADRNHQMCLSGVKTFGHRCTAPDGRIAVSVKDQGSAELEAERQSFRIEQILSQGVQGDNQDQASCFFRGLGRLPDTDPAVAVSST